MSDGSKAKNGRLSGYLVRARLTTWNRTTFSAHPHTSVTSICAETLWSGWWVLSVISRLKTFRKTSDNCYHQSITASIVWSSGLLRIQCWGLSVAVFSLLFIFWLSSSVNDGLTTNNTMNAVKEKTKRSGQMSAKCRAFRSSRMSEKPAQKIFKVHTLLYQNAAVKLSSKYWDLCVFENFHHINSFRSSPGALSHLTTWSSSWENVPFNYLLSLS